MTSKQADGKFMHQGVKGAVCSRCLMACVVRLEDIRWRSTFCYHPSHKDNTNNNNNCDRRQHKQQLHNW